VAEIRKGWVKNFYPFALFLGLRYGQGLGVIYAPKNERIRKDFYFYKVFKVSSIIKGWRGF
jgi:hypothetical protein